MDSIDDTLAGLPQNEHDALQRVIDTARRVAPHAIDGVSSGGYPARLRAVCGH